MCVPWCCSNRSRATPAGVRRAAAATTRTHTGGEQKRLVRLDLMSDCVFNQYGCVSWQIARTKRKTFIYRADKVLIKRTDYSKWWLHTGGAPIATCLKFCQCTMSSTNSSITLVHTHTHTRVLAHTMRAHTLLYIMQIIL